MTSTTAPTPERRAGSDVALGAVLLIVAGMLAVTTLVVVSQLAGIVLFMTLAAVGVGLLLLARPVRVLYIYILLLPFHSLIIALLVAQVGVPTSIVRAVAAWKELLLLGTFVLACMLWLSRGKFIRLTWVDWVTVAWLAQVSVYFVLQDFVVPISVPLVARAYGARDWLLFILPYFIGRLLVMGERTLQRVLALVAAVGVVTATIGIIEVLFVPTAWHIRLGTPIYLRDFLGLIYPDYLGGLPPNYWAEVGSRNIRRAVSVYFSAQGLALSFLVIFPVVIYRFAARQTWARLAVVAICGLGLLLSITRMTIIACYLQAILILWQMARRWSLGLLIGVPLIVALVLFALSSQVRTFVVSTVTLSDTSSRVRPARWAAGIEDLAAYPQGMGLGVTGTTGTRFNLGGGGDEAGYFKVTGALGLPGLLIFLAWFGGVIAAAWRLWRRGPPAMAPLGLLVTAMAGGFLLNNLTAPPDQLPFTIYVFAWLAGTAVQLASHSLPVAPEGR